MVETKVKHNCERINVHIYTPSSPYFSSLSLLAPNSRSIPRSKPFDRVFDVLLSTEHYAIGDFLMDLFLASGRSGSHGKALSAFLRGTSTFGLGEVLERLDAIVGQFEDPRERSWTLDTPYKELKSGRAAITAYAAQKVRDRLSAE